MNEQQNEKAPVKYHWGRLLAAALAVLAFFVIRGCLGSGSREYRILDHAAVEASPDLYEGERARLECVVVDTVKNSDEDITSILVSEQDRDDHIWFVFGNLSEVDAVRIEPGVSLSLSGTCSGTIGVQFSEGELRFPAICFSKCSVGVQTGHTSSYLHALRIGRLQAEIRARDYEDESHEFVLTAGHYWIQTDLPGGSLTLGRVSGSGAVSGEGPENDFNVSMTDEPSTWRTITLDNMTSGYINVSGSLILYAKYDNVNFRASEITEYPEEAFELGAGTYTIEDFPVNRASFNIKAVSGSGDVIGGDPEDSGIDAHMSASPSGRQCGEFHRFLMFSEHDTLTITGDLIIRLTPFETLTKKT